MKSFLIILLTLITISCTESNKDENTVLNEEKWSLKSVSCECEPLILDLGEYVLDFNIDNGTVEVENNVSNDNGFLLPRGTYEMEKTSETITINGIWYKYTLSEDQLILDENGQSIVDAPLYIYEKN